MIEQLFPEVTCYALRYLDYSSLCQLSMTSSSMRKTANDDVLWRALYFQEFTEETNGGTPVNGWKAFFAVTKQVMTVNDKFFSILDSRSLPRMTSLWLNSDYVKCFNGSGELFTGFDAVMQRWDFCFDNWEIGFPTYVIESRTRILSSVAWVSTIALHHIGQFNITNVFELHNGRWLMVHHHSSIIPTNGVEN
ncbi:F-box family protein [Arabidopsis thaliana]|nr:F-box family protein [Arabidopsis thaliana]ANM66251.1 F-box family protein [Arabidopsis thaliana]|eukprot:NP_001328160.1 F-box family protein [Arabidopsis thaliana]